MSVDNFVFLRSEQMPQQASLQQALDAAGTGIVLEQVDDMHEHTGYWPAQFRGHDSGFEWSFGTIEEVFGDASE